MELWDILLRGLLACIVLVGIHTYFGLFVLERGIVFADLALAQMAGMGVVAALLLDAHPPSPKFYAVVLGLNGLSAYLVAHASRMQKVSHAEAAIGLIYVGGTAGSLLLLERAPHGLEQVRALFSGEILWVSYPTLAETAALYALIALLHRALWTRISGVLTRSSTFGTEVFFLFTFAMVVTSSVQIGGVLLVFAYLAGTSLISASLAQGFVVRLFIGWGIGAAASIFGLLLSYLWDLPAAPVIVAVICIIYGVVLAVRRWLPKDSRLAQT